MPTLKNAKHELFCRYINEGKTSDASYELAGFKRARANAARLKARPEIKARIKELQNQGMTRHEVTVDKIVEEYAKLAFSDIRQMFDEDGNVIPPKDLNDNIAAAMQSIKVTSRKGVDGEVEHIADFKLSDKRMALRDLGQHMTMFKEDVTIKAEVVQHTVSDLELARRLAYLIAKGAHALPVPD